jgi:hypothetical protein
MQKAEVVLDVLPSAAGNDWIHANPVAHAA